MGNFFRNLGRIGQDIIDFERDLLKKELEILAGSIGPLAGIVGAAIGGPAGAIAGAALGEIISGEVNRQPTTGFGPPPPIAPGGPAVARPGVPIPLPGGTVCTVVPVSERTENLAKLSAGLFKSVTRWNDTHDIVCTAPPAVVSAGGFFDDLLMDPLAGMRVGGLIDIPPGPNGGARPRSERGAPAGVLWSAIKKREHRRSRFPRGCPSRGFLDAFTAPQPAMSQPAICFTAC